MKTIRGGVVVLCALLGSTPNQARSLIDQGPLADTDDVAVDVLFGNALGIEPDPGTPLFDGDSAGAAVLKSDLMAAVAQHLRRGGLQVVPKSESEVQIGLFGGKFSGGSPDAKNFFMVQATVCRPGGMCAPERTVLGVIDDSRLSQAIISAATNIVDDFVARRMRWRQSRH